MKSEQRVDKTLDATGLLCPEPVFRARRCLADMEAGQILEIRADDPLAEIDLAVFCERTGHAMLARDHADGCWTFLLCKAGV
ncbi:MAG: sulfurtransferase TusA family protein [Wenzhouxiangellaceae bacterium]|jgi:tRNA 2-thiouridine synthesizing protein A|nr:sulfurtransferase TusA family protein [Wenzhouxiangellaceae bacterium]MBS3747932.1 sulfurtransferase TusA family protein [Wenzhouxiangellaceae bacterium]MBS3824154.1 sulfurtransferase TusA family protein [Wenzhouxiangellaceae bacterium]